MFIDPFDQEISVDRRVTRGIALAQGSSRTKSSRKAIRRAIGRRLFLL